MALSDKTDAMAEAVADYLAVEKARAALNVALDAQRNSENRLRSITVMSDYPVTLGDPTGFVTISAEPRRGNFPDKFSYTKSKGIVE